MFNYANSCENESNFSSRLAALKCLLTKYVTHFELSKPSIATFLRKDLIRVATQ